MFLESVLDFENGDGWRCDVTDQRKDAVSHPFNVMLSLYLTDLLFGVNSNSNCASPRPPQPLGTTTQPIPWKLSAQYGTNTPSQSPNFMNRADFIKSDDHINLFTIISDAMFRTDSVPTRRGFKDYSWRRINF
jgi:hypothetical protein